MSIVAACPCGKRFSLPDEMAGQPVDCPACGRPQVAPLSEPDMRPVAPPSASSDPPSPSASPAPQPPSASPAPQSPPAAANADLFPPNYRPKGSESAPPAPTPSQPSGPSPASAVPTPLPPTANAPASSPAPSSSPAPTLTPLPDTPAATPQPMMQRPPPPSSYAAPQPETPSPSMPEAMSEQLVELPLDDLVSQEQTAAPALYPQGWSTGYRPQSRSSGMWPVLLIGCLGVGGVLLVLLIVGGIAAYFFLPGINHVTGSTQQAASASSPIAAFKANQRFLIDQNYAAAYYFFDAPSREYLDSVAKRYGLRDGIELMEKLYGFDSSSAGAELDEQTQEALAEFSRQMQGIAEKMMESMEFSEEINGDRGAVLLRLKGMPPSMAARVEMVREDGVWRHPISSDERSRLERQAASKLGGSRSFGAR